jgi:DNA-binding response OmpR family regulator
MLVLVVGSDESGADSLARDLRRHGYDVDQAKTGRAALRAHWDADIVLLDLDLPDLDGLAVCRTVRRDWDVPVIAVTDRDDELDRVLALQAGSDDCMVRPFGFRELLARMDAIMRRIRPRPPAGRAISSGPMSVDPDKREVRMEGRILDLTRKEFDLLHYLASRPEQTASRGDLMSHVWGYRRTASSRTLDMHVYSLRRKLGAASWITTVHGVGFRMGAPPIRRPARRGTLAPVPDSHPA